MIMIKTSSTCNRDIHPRDPRDKRYVFCFKDAVTGPQHSRARQKTKQSNNEQGFYTLNRRRINKKTKTKKLNVKVTQETTNELSVLREGPQQERGVRAPRR